MNKAARALLGEAIECLESKNARATDICAQILKDYPDNVPALQVMGVSLMQAERPVEALGYLERARELAPDESAPHFHLGQVYLSLNRAEEAFAAFDADPPVGPI